MITLAKANKELKKVADYFKENESAWNEQRNLKLYDAASYDYEEDFPLTFKKYGFMEFDNFCTDMYDLFLEWLAEENIKEKILFYVGSTSSFYISKYNGENVPDISTVYESVYINISDYKITLSEEWKLTSSEVQNELNYIVNNLLDDVKATFEPVTKVANYIDEFKKNQLDYFKHYLAREEVDLQVGKEKQDAEIEANNKKVDELISKVKSIITLEELNMIDRLYMKEEN